MEAGRNYILNEESGDKRPASRRPTRKLNLDLLDKIENEIHESNVKNLVRSESMEKIKFRIRTFHPDDNLIRLAKRNATIRRRPSVPSKLDFESYKFERHFDDNHSSLGEREWTRQIWNEWFDEVIPLLDGTFAKESKINDTSNAQKDSTLIGGVKFDSIGWFFILYRSFFV